MERCEPRVEHFLTSPLLPFKMRMRGELCIGVASFLSQVFRFSHRRLLLTVVPSSFAALVLLIFTHVRLALLLLLPYLIQIPADWTDKHVHCTSRNLHGMVYNINFGRQLRLTFDSDGTIVFRLE